MAKGMKTGDLTKGNPLKLIVQFALPLMVGNIFQQLYTVVDTVVVGKTLQVQALAAMGNAGGLNWLIVGMILGLTQGFSVLISQEFGARRTDALKHVIGLSVVLSAAGAVILVTVAEAMLHPVLILLNTPQESIGYALRYMRVMYGGIPIVMAFNLLSGILRALGDSQTPLKAMIVAALTNVALDIALVVVIPFGIVGAAVASLMGQLVSCVYCFTVIRKHELMKLERRHFRMDWALAGRMIRLGVPIALMNAISMVGAMLVQSVVNGHGVIFAAAYTANHSLYGVLEIAATSCGYAVTTYMGQNLGAGEHRRIRQGMGAGVLIGIVTAAITSGILFLFGRSIVGWFISGTPEEVLQTTDLACQYLRIMATFLPVLYFLHIFRAALQGLGNSLLPMVSGVGECIMRIGCAVLIPLYFTRTGIFYAEALAWLGADLVLIPSYFWQVRRLEKKSGF